MRAVVITPPAPVVTWAQAAAHLNLGTDDTDKVYVEGLIEAATSALDGPEGWLGRALGQQTLEVRFDSFLDQIVLPYPPTISITSVGYVDQAGAAQVVSSTAYELIGRGVFPVYGAAWPSARWQRNALTIRYLAGYATGVPAAIRHAILLMVGDLYRFRETVVPSANASKVPIAANVEALLSTFRVYA